MKKMSNRLCINCNNSMELVAVVPGHISRDTDIYKCTKCNHAERVTTISKAWLYVCSKELRSPN